MNEPMSGTDPSSPSTDSPPLWRRALYWCQSHPIISWITLVLACLWILWPWMMVTTTPDESTFIYQSYLVSLDKVPYRDFFDFIWPGLFYLGGLLIKTFGMSLVMLRGFVCILLTLALMMLWRMSRAFLPLRWKIAMITIIAIIWVPMALVFHHQVISTWFSVASVFMLFLTLETQHDIYQNKLKTIPWYRLPAVCLPFSGLLAGCTLLITQSLGTPFCGLISLFMLAYTRLNPQASEGFGTERKSSRWYLPFLMFLSGLLLSPLILLGYIQSAGLSSDFWYDTFHWLFEGYARTTFVWYFADGFTDMRAHLMLGFPWNLQRLLIATTLVFQGILPIYGLLWPLEIGKQLFRQQLTDIQKLRGWQIILLWFGGLAGLLGSLSYPTSVLISHKVWLLYLLMFIGSYQYLRQFPVLRKRLGMAVILLIAFGLFRMAEDAYALRQAPKVVSYGTREAFYYASPKEVPEKTKAVNELINFIHQGTPPGESVFAYNLMPELYLYTGRLNPTRYQYLIKNYNTQAQIDEAARELSLKLPAMILYNHLDDFYYQHDYRFQAAKQKNPDYHLHALEEVITAHYGPAGSFENLELFVRRDIPALSPARPAENPEHPPIAQPMPPAH